MCLYVCRFTADAEVDLEDPLSALGITDMFSVAKADFRHLSESVQIQEYLQQVYLDLRKA